MKKIVLFIFTGLLLIFLLLFGIYEIMNSRSFQLFGSVTDQVDTKEQVVALTFDDGPSENVNELLPLLEKYNAKATFFLIGKEIEQYPMVTKHIVEAGHQVGNHSYSHQRMVFKTPGFIREEIENTDVLIQQAGFKGEIDFRPPNGKKLVVLPKYL